MYYYIDKEVAKESGRPLLLKKTTDRILDLDSEFGAGVAVELIADKLPFAVVYDESTNSVRAASTQERQARSTKRLYAGVSLISGIYTKQDFSISDFVAVAGDTMNGTLILNGTVPMTLPYNRGIRVYNSSNAQIECLKSSGSEILIVASGTSRVGGNFYVNGVMTATGDVVAFSDLKLKKNITNIGKNALTMVNNMRGVYYDRRDDNSKHIGFIAQEVEKILPELIFKDPDTGLKAVAYGNVTAVCVEAIKELTNKVKMLERRVSELEGGK